MRVFVNSRECEIPTNSDGTVDGSVLRERSCVSANRALILKKPDGANEIINPGQQVRVDPGQHFSDMPLHVRGQ
jgi:hypothetical protein